MSDRVCYVYTAGFLQHLEESAALKDGEWRVAIAGDVRPSTRRVATAVVRAPAIR